jgi:hypothetical protein
MQKWKKKLRKAATRSKNELKDAKHRLSNQFFLRSAKIQFRVTIFEPALSGFGGFSKTHHTMAP